MQKVTTFIMFEGKAEEAMGFYVSLFPGSEIKIDALFAKLSEGGQVLMPLDAYPFSKKFGWANDKYGVSWQLTLAGS